MLYDGLEGGLFGCFGKVLKCIGGGLLFCGVDFIFWVKFDL